MYKESISEFFERVSKEKTKKGKVEILQREHNPTIEAIVDLAFNPKLTFRLPEGEPPYKAASEAEDLQGVLYANMRKFGIFLENGPYPGMRPFKVQQQFIDFLEALDPHDAKMVLAIKEKKLPYKGVTRKLFEEAWPSLAATWK